MSMFMVFVLKFAKIFLTLLILETIKDGKMKYRFTLIFQQDHTRTCGI
jgi:hypothetical protein